MDCSVEKSQTQRATFTFICIALPVTVGNPYLGFRVLQCPGSYHLGEEKKAKQDVPL